MDLYVEVNSNGFIRCCTPWDKAVNNQTTKSNTLWLLGPLTDQLLIINYILKILFATIPQCQQPV